MKKNLLILLFFLNLVAYSQTAKVCIAQFQQDSLMVSINDIIKKPCNKNLWIRVLQNYFMRNNNKR